MSQLSNDLGRDKPDAWSRLLELERRDWAVRVLDFHRFLRELTQTPAPLWQPSGRYGVYVLMRQGGRHVWGMSPDAARLAAAEAVFSELPADVRAALGERP